MVKGYKINNTNEQGHSQSSQIISHVYGKIPVIIVTIVMRSVMAMRRPVRSVNIMMKTGMQMKMMKRILRKVEQQDPSVKH